MFTALFTAAEFDQASIVVNPVEWAIGAARALRCPISTDQAAKQLAGVLRSLGQLPFSPPNVSGWPSGQAWMSTSTADVRIRAAAVLVRAATITSVVEDAGLGSDRIVPPAT